MTKIICGSFSNFINNEFNFVNNCSSFSIFYRGGGAGRWVGIYKVHEFLPMWEVLLLEKNILSKNRGGRGGEVGGGI